MRPKFRIWHKTEKKMYQLEGIDLTDRQGNYGYIVEWDNYGTIYNSLAKEDAELMQFTGLLDKHGREVYEGDIVEYLELTLTVAWNDVLARPLLQPYTIAHHFDLNVDIAEECSVIGNIYETPELLQQH